MGTILHVEAPMLEGQLHQVFLHFDTDRPDGITLSLDIEGFLRDWRIPEEPEILRLSKWDVLMADDDL